jgi:signal transduction histidine kinase
MNRGTTNHLAEEQAALRRVATLVASAPKPELVFEAVAEEAGRLLGAGAAVISRFDAEMVTTVGHWNGGEGGDLAVGTRFPYSAPGNPVRVAAFEGGRIDDYTDIPGEAARITREFGYRSAVIAPIIADGRSWGALFVFSATAHHFGRDAEQRLSDFTKLVALALESAEARDQTGRLAEEQAALRRVATLVASSPDPEQIFAAVAEEAGRLLGARTAATVRFDEHSGVIAGRWHDGEGAGVEVGTLVPYSDPDSPVYRASHHGGRIDDYTDVPGEAARLTRLAGYRSAVVAPITAGGRLWGALFVFSASTGHFRPGAQQRLADFTNLVALALESAEAHDQLTASRARIVEASVDERRRLERNLHDGAQQRLVTLAVHLRIAQECLGEDPAAAEAMLAGVGEDLKLALEELRELARGLHPAVLSERGLEPALQSLANRAPFPVEIVGVPPLRLAEGVEAAVYYVVAESLTNAAKHADASEGCVQISATEEEVTVEIRDNGSGGASMARGSGLRGLADRIEALGGQLELQSPSGGGTIVRATLPLG